MRKCYNKGGQLDGRKKKKQKCTGNISNTGTSTSTSFGLVGDILTCEILSRLPVKSLMRFKCVCKNWQFLIANDMYFINLHLTRSKTRPILFMSFPTSLENPTEIIDGVIYDRVLERKTEILLTADLLSQGRGNAVSAAKFHTVREIDASFFDTMLGPVNGLIGFYDSHTTCGVSVCDVSTREVTPWIKSTLLEDFEEEEGDKFNRYMQSVDSMLGFDPATKVHKVVSIWSITHADYNRDRDVVCEVLTIGDDKWTRTDEIPPYNTISFRRALVYVNGFVYYASRDFMTSEPDNDKIVAFDVGSEKFTVIRVPKFIIDQPRETKRFFGSSITLLEVDCRLALLCKMSGYVVKLWLFDHNHNDWSEVATIELPYLWDEGRKVHFLSVPGMDQIILKSYLWTNNLIHGLSFHSYNWRNKTFMEVQINGMSIRDAYFLSSNRVTTMVESLWPAH
ncbi:hypothetical protein MKW98_029344 [Papaver atlanticum]|uniref:F-box domain-containing protein n=1 Tax=Papaver atlanticum TaxID=357466 RepID=A0AAD4SHY4_9MAGN|nr:hypothetical protein MKW98_029344 [Papaver atlanticum]